MVKAQYKFILVSVIALTLIPALFITTSLNVVLADDPAYIGSGTCGMCHAEQYSAWEDSQHKRKLLSVEEAQALGLHEPPEGYTWDDILYVIGSKWKSRYVDLEGYIITDSGGEPGSNQWNYATEEWVDYHAGEVKTYSCGSCHTTGYDPEGHQDGIEGIVGTWAERNIACESCHGPGGNHITGPSANPMAVDLGAELCGTCHSRPKGAVEYEFNDPDSFSYVPGEGPHKHHQQYTDWNISGHSEELEPFLRDSCLKCKSTDNIYNTDLLDKAAKTVTIAEAYNGITCVSCHEPHALNLWITRQDDESYPIIFEPGSEADKNSVCIQCHVGGGTPDEKTKAHWHHTQGEMHMESIHYISGATCSDCHMPLDSKSAVAYDIKNHSMSVMSYGTYDYTCGQASGCHQEQGSEWAATVIDDIQTTVSGAIELAEEAFNNANGTVYAALADGVSEATIGDAQDLLLEAESHLTFVDSDGSHGFHNPQLALSLLQKSVNFAREAEATALDAVAEMSSAQAAALETEKASLESEKESLEAEKESLATEVSTLQSDVSTLQGQVEDLQSKAGGGTTNMIIGAVVGLLIGAIAVYFLIKK